MYILYSYLQHHTGTRFNTINKDTFIIKVISFPIYLGYDNHYVPNAFVYMLHEGN